MAYKVNDCIRFFGDYQVITGIIRKSKKGIFNNKYWVESGITYMGEIAHEINWIKEKDIIQKI